MTSTLRARTKEKSMGATYPHASLDGHIAAEHDGVGSSYDAGPHETPRRTP